MVVPGGLAGDNPVGAMAGSLTARRFRTVNPAKIPLKRLRHCNTLLFLIDTMLQREPSLASLVQLSAPATRQTADGAAYRRMAARALRYDDPGRVAVELTDLLRVAGEMTERRHWTRAGMVYQAVLAELADGFGRELLSREEDWGIAAAGGDCLEGLELCLTEGRPKSELRQEWLETVLTAALADIALGGIDFAYSAIDTVLDHASPREWPALEQRIHAALNTYGDRARETLVEWLVAWRQKHGRPAEADEVIRELGTREQHLLLLVRQGRAREAVARARQDFPDKPGTITRLADALVQSGAGAEAVAMVTAQARGPRTDQAYLEWLASHFRGQDETESALYWQREVFLRQPEARKYFVLRRIAVELGAWPEVRSEVLARLEADRRTDKLLEIAVVEEDAERALDLFSRLTPTQADHFRPMVAGVTAKTHPRRAIEFYKEMVEAAIGRRNPSAYREAADHLGRIKSLTGEIGADREWEDYLNAMKNKYARLSAFHYELARAGL